MTQQELVINLARNNTGMFTTQQAIAHGISRGTLQYMTNQGKIQRATRGVYILPEVWEDEFLNLQTRFKRGIFSHETALFLCNLTDRTPIYFHMTFPTNYNLTNPQRESVRCSQIKSDLYSLGIECVKSPAGNVLYSYSAERTLCDLLRPFHSSDIQIVAEAFNNYLKSNKKNIPKLSSYATLLKVEKKIRTYLEVLL